MSLCDYLSVSSSLCLCISVPLSLYVYGFVLSVICRLSLFPSAEVLRLSFIAGAGAAGMVGPFLVNKLRGDSEAAELEKLLQTVDPVRAR